MKKSLKIKITNSNQGMSYCSLSRAIDVIPKGRIDIEEILREQLADLKKDGHKVNAKGLIWDCLEKKKI